MDDAQSFALQAAEPYVKEGFQVREDFWGGDLGAGEKKAVRQQLFKGNEYWFWLGTDVEKASMSVHIYDAEGKLVEQPDSWQKGQFAAARITPACDRHLLHHCQRRAVAGGADALGARLRFPVGILTA